MKIVRCDIINFRSIKELTIHFDKRIKIFIGFNEAGKSNIIKALSLLIKDNNTSEDDIRDFYSDDKYQDNAYVRFIFEFDSNETDALFQDILKKIFIKNETDISTLSNLCHTHNQLIYHIDLKNKTKGYRYWTIDDDEYQLEGELNEIKAVSSKSVKIGEETISLNNYGYILMEGSFEIDDEIIEDAEFQSIINLLFELKKELAKKLHPQVVFWSFNNFNVIPQKINIDSFIGDQNSCVALKNMFKLSGINDIKNEIQLANNKKNGLTNLLKRLSKTTTEYIHSVWNEQQTIRINLHENGSDIEFGIEDEKNLFEFSRRSDGFKRFISFLLSIGAQNKTKDLENIILLIDEPDIGLHPSSSRQLMNELINISRRNFVYYTTHSIFMINKENINSHYIVTKEKEVTDIKEVETTNILDEEVLYNALGYSVFDNLKKNNIIFEGWRDKKLFTIGLTYFNKNDSFNNILNEIGFCYSQGVKDIHRISAILDLAKRNYIIISDADKPAQEARERSHEKNKWLTYSDFCKGIVTSEDFLNLNYSNSCFVTICKNHGLSIIIDKELKSSNLLFQYAGILTTYNVDKEEQKKIFNDYKELVYENLLLENIEKEYFNFIETLLLNFDKYTDNSSNKPGVSSNVP